MLVARRIHSGVGKVESGRCHDTITTLMCAPSSGARHSLSHEQAGGGWPGVQKPLSGCSENMIFRSRGFLP